MDVSDLIREDIRGKKGASVVIQFTGGYIHVTRDPDDGEWEVGASEGAYVFGIDCKLC